MMQDWLKKMHRSFASFIPLPLIILSILCDGAKGILNRLRKPTSRFTIQSALHLRRKYDKLSLPFLWQTIVATFLCFFWARKMGGKENREQEREGKQNTEFLCRLHLEMWNFEPTFNPCHKIRFTLLQFALWNSWKWHCYKTTYVHPSCKWHWCKEKPNIYNCSYIQVIQCPPWRTFDAGCIRSTQD